jgi:predicted nucleic acid-binding protein
MGGLVLVGGALAIFLVSAGGVAASTIVALQFAGGAFNKTRPVGQRRVRAALAALAVLGIPASATAGYAGIAALMYYGQKAEAARER